ncbi:hypothetical protein [Streptomyces gobiensis]|uniref:hypothetical protein n=1 Tax=Streptomyces gobiensis TaxID=2875706 RepID=UPI001E42300A|nr:hypothetical protein [Streptomyces gobiensis]UGY95065.1 hypothetical protein test1122_08030 [Streptomyces gobiensis]
MIASSSSQGYSALELLLVIPVGLIIAASFAVYGFVTLAQHGARREGIVFTARSLAALVASAAVAMYVWGAFHLVMDETMVREACQEAVGEAIGMEYAAHIDRYESSYIPLGLGCHVKNGDTYIVGVPDYVNPATAVFGLTAVALGAFSFFESERRLTKKFKKETGSC